MNNKTPLESFWDDLIAKPMMVVLSGAIGAIVCLFSVLLFVLGHTLLGLLGLALGGGLLAISARLFYL